MRGDEVLRMLVTGGPPVRGGGGMLQRIVTISVTASVFADDRRGYRRERRPGSTRHGRKNKDRCIAQRSLISLGDFQSTSTISVMLCRQLIR